MDTIKCTYCGKEAEWVENKEVYGRSSLPCLIDKAIAIEMKKSP